MAEFLTEEWLERLAALGGDLPAVEGLDGIIGFEITDAPSGKMRAHVTVVDGVITGAAMGKSKEARVSLVLGADLAHELLTGEADFDVAYMRGDIKVSDDYEVIVFDAHQSSGLRSLADALAGETTR